MAASQGSLLQKQELDAFIVQAFAMELTNPNYLQDLQVWKYLNALEDSLANPFIFFAIFFFHGQAANEG